MLEEQSCGPVVTASISFHALMKADSGIPKVLGDGASGAVSLFGRIGIHGCIEGIAANDLMKMS